MRRLFIPALFLVLFLIPAAKASGAVSSITITAPETMVFDQEQVVVVELADSEKNPVSGKTPVITFAPSKSVEKVDWFDCFDSAVSDACKANNRGVEGVYESHFVLADAPVTMSVTIDGVTEKKVLNGLEASAKPSEPDSGTEAIPLLAPAKVVVPASLQVGPSPSILFLILPLAVISLVVTVFVVSTHE